MILVSVAVGKRGVPVVFFYPVFRFVAIYCEITKPETPPSERNKELELTSINDISTWDTRSEQDTRSMSEGTHQPII
ncbi:hypothetical protein BT96DRAFT_8152 [Gymnopus androsaceus JB14]|uniref:Uncharacterized protein n=1 Tax=Gymnopus androsaceus JB14 TaxID=1447944 RepID=A0A6A4ILM8_9AGAR|nr:hypothetical protein BT96DRAFT_8152 [Gymnopus androsaceus JB14]